MFKGSPLKDPIKMYMLRQSHLSWDTDVFFNHNTFSLFPRPWASRLEIVPQPLQDDLTQSAVPRLCSIANIEVLHLIPLLDTTHMHMNQVCRPVCQIIQNMRSIHHRTRPRLRLPLQELQKVMSAEQIQIDRNFIQQQQVPRPQ